MSNTNRLTTTRMESLAVELIQCTDPSIQPRLEHDRIATTQMQHRINLLQAWFGSLDAAKDNLEGKTVLEIGCGQGDMTVALAWAVGFSGTVHAIDPAPPDYGSPETLQEAQQRISRSPLGARIKWKRCEPVEALKRDPLLKSADFIVLAHSLLYMDSMDYIANLLRALARDPGVSTTPEATSSTLLVAEWGMRASHEGARAHLYAVQAQAVRPLRKGNVQLYLEPNVTVELASSAGWKVEKETWVNSPDLDDGKWEVAAAMRIPLEDDTDGATGDFLEELGSQTLGPTRCMDVWTVVLQ